MNEIEFGVFLPPTAAAPERLGDHARAAEAAGFDYVSVQDHPYNPAFLDSLITIAHGLARTTRLRFLTNVANLPLRPAPMLAKAAASLDLLSSGRFDLGIGGGRLWEEIAGLGGPRWSPADVVAATGEAIDVIRAIWLRDRVLDVEGQYYSLTNARSGPAPSDRLRLWLGAAGPRMLNLLGRRADGWIAPIGTPFETKPAAQDLIDASATAAGRRPTDIRRAIQLVGTVTHRSAAQARPRSGPGNQAIQATSEVWAQIIIEFITQERFDTVNFLPIRAEAEQLDWFGREVIPLVRAGVVAAT